MCVKGYVALDPVGNPLTKDIPAGVISYSYDRLNRLSTEHHPTAGLTTHQYDLSGRRTTQISASATTVFAYDQADQLTSKIEKPGLADIHNTYRPDGIRHGKEGPNGSEAFLRDPVTGEVVFWNRSSGGVMGPAQLYASGATLGRAIGQQSAGVGEDRPYHTDELGSVLAITDDAGTTETSYQLSAFGKVISGSATNNPYDYAADSGYWRDTDTGLIYVEQRWYDPDLGLWLSADPVEGEPRYAYCYNQPTVRTDATGLAPPDGPALSPTRAQELQHRVTPYLPYIEKWLTRGDSIPRQDLFTLWHINPSLRESYMSQGRMADYSEVGRTALLLSAALMDVNWEYMTPQQRRAALVKERELRTQWISSGADIDIQEANRQAAQDMARAWRAGFSITSNELTFGALDWLKLTNSAAYDDVPGAAGSHILAAAGRDLLITVFGGGSVAKVTQQASKLARIAGAGARGAKLASTAGRVSMGAARSYSAIQAIRGTYASARHVMSGEATWADIVQLGVTLVTARRNIVALRSSGAKGLGEYYSAKVEPPPPGSYYPDTNVIKAATVEQAKRRAGTTSERDVIGGVEFAEQHKGNLVIIESVESEALNLRTGPISQADFNRFMIKYNVRMIPDPTQPQVDRLIKSIRARASGQVDVAILTAAKEHGGVLVTGDVKLLDDLLAAKQYGGVQFRQFQGDIDQAIGGYTKARNRVILLRDKGIQTGDLKSHVRYKWPADPNIPNPDEIVFPPRTR